MEVQVAVGVLVVSLLSLLAALGSSQRLRSSTDEEAQALAVLRLEQDRCRALPPEALVAEVLAAEPAGQPRAERAIPGLRSGVLRLTLLSEEQAQVAFGLAQAPNLDRAEGSDPELYRVVPVLLTLEWTAPDGRPREVSLRTWYYRGAGSW